MVRRQATRKRRNLAVQSIGSRVLKNCQITQQKMDRSGWKGNESECYLMFFVVVENKNCQQMIKTIDDFKTEKEQSCSKCHFSANIDYLVTGFHHWKKKTNKIIRWFILCCYWSFCWPLQIRGKIFSSMQSVDLCCSSEQRQSVIEQS